MSNGLLELELWFLCLANLSYFWSTSDELERSLTDVCRTWPIFDRRLSDLSYLWPTSVGHELSLTDVWRTWAICDRRLTSLDNFWPTSDGHELSFIGEHSNTRGEPPKCWPAEPVPPSYPIRFLNPTCKNPSSAAWLGNWGHRSRQLRREVCVCAYVCECYIYMYIYICIHIYIYIYIY